MNDVRFDEAFLADPAAAWRALAARGPVHRAEMPDAGPAWLVVGHDEVVAGASDPRLSLERRHAAAGGYTGFALPPSLDRNLLNLDGADHARVRRLVARAFTPRRVAALRPAIDALADDLAAALAASLSGSGAGNGGPVDLLAAFAAPLPITVIARLLGVPGSGTADVRAWTDRMLAPVSRADAADAVATLERFLVDLVATTRAAPGDDLLGDLVTAREGDDRLSGDELTSAAFLVLFAGYENTTNVVGNGVARLLARPGGLRALPGDEAGVAAVVEELMRVDPPPQLAIRRFAVEDLDIAGVRVRAGETVLLSWAAANQQTARHLTFGTGPHACLGAALARAELASGFAALRRHVPGLALAGPLDWRPSFRNRGLRTLPVVVT